MSVVDRRPERTIRGKEEEREAAASLVKTSEAPKLHPLRRLRELWRYREVLGNLTRKAVRIKYTSSVLGAAWSMLNPVMYLAVFSFAFTVVLPSGVPDFPVYLLSGLLAWSLFAGSVTLAAGSVVENANLVKKVYFPREILPLAAIGATLVDFALQAVVLIVFMAIFTYPFFGTNLLLLPLSMATLLLFASALALWVSALNVRYRDTNHLLNLALLAWFWVTPIVYPFGYLQDRITDWMGQAAFFGYLMINPMAVIIAGFQRSIYRFVDPVGDPNLPTVLLNTSLGSLTIMLGMVILGSLALVLLFWRYYFRQAGDFAEEL